MGNKDVKYVHKETIRVYKLTDQMKDITGEKNGFIEALAPHHQEILYYKHQRPAKFMYWTFLCHRCDEEFIARGTLINDVASKACGCYRLEEGVRRGGQVTAAKTRSKPSKREGVRYRGIMKRIKDAPVCMSTVFRRLNKGWSVEDALTSPPRANNMYTKNRHIV